LDLPRTHEGEEQVVGLNFLGITLPPGVEIISALIQDMVDRPGWGNGNSISFIIKGLMTRLEKRNILWL